jgi:HK97 family phage major capsid protein
MSKKLYEDRAAVWAGMEELVSKGADTWSAEDTKKYEDMETEYRSLSDRIAHVEAFEKLAKPAGAPIDAGAVKPAEDRDAYFDAFDAYLRRGYERLTSEQRTLLEGARNSEGRTMDTTTDSEGGYLVPEVVRPRLIEALKAYGGLRNLAEVITTSNGQKLNLPGNDDTANMAEIIAENIEVGDQDLDFTNVGLDVFIYSSKAVRVPISLLEDSVVDLGAYVTRKQGERIGRKQADGWVNGSGTNEPLGILAGRDTGKDVNITAAFTYDNLVDVIHAVDPAYRAMGSSFVMSDAALAGARKLKDSQNRPIWEPSVQAGDPDRLLGYPVVIDQAMGADAAGEQPVAFGAWSEAYIVRDVASISVLRLAELYARFHQVAYIGFVRSGGTVKNKAAYAVIDRTA